MIQIAGHKAVKKIFESEDSLIYRGFRVKDRRAEILKILKENFKSPMAVNRYNHEFNIIRSSVVEGVIKFYKMETYVGRPVIILEDINGESLDRLLLKSQNDLKEVLNIFIKTTKILGNIHGANIIHRDINPSNIIMNPKTKEIKIIDFGFAKLFAHEDKYLKGRHAFEGTLPYMSPEQTGRMNRSEDYRTDFYSLGVTFYELITGRLPFQTNDTLEIIHCHVAKEPKAPYQIDTKIPKMVSDIIMKLLAKNVDQRYQSTWGIRFDLEKCLNLLDEKNSIQSFPLAQNDFSEKFYFFQKFFGRKREIEIIENAFDKVVEGSRQHILVGGFAGIGKTSLIQKMCRPIILQKGYFISGKFDQYHQNIPYNAFVNAFRELVRQILSESDDRLEFWRRQLLGVLGVNGKIIIDVIPEVELVIGPQLSPPRLDPVSAKNRFNMVFQNFIRSFCRSDEPLTIFLDDVQWADAGSLRLLEILMSSGHLKHILLICAYRENEIGPDHPFMIAVNALEKENRSVKRILLKPLNLVDVTRMVSDTLNVPEKDVKSLAELIIQKTGGNPFFIKHFLNSLLDNGLLFHNIFSGHWQWDIPQIQSLSITDNVIDLLNDKINRLSLKGQNVLKLAACIGKEFKIQMLARLFQQSTKDTNLAVSEALSEGLLVPLEMSPDMAAYREGEKDIRDDTISYRFAHDRIQQATYSLLPEKEQQETHKKIGQVLLEITPQEKQKEAVFDIVNQLNLSLNLIRHPSEREQLKHLNVLAGRKANISAAYDMAFKYFQYALKLLDVQSWSRDYKNTLKLYIEAAEAAYLCSNYQKMEEFTDVILANAQTLLDNVKAYEVKIEACKAQYKLDEAVEIALMILKLLGISFNEKPGKLKTIRSFLGSKWAVSGKRIDNLIDLPPMNDPIKITAIRIIARIGSPAYFVRPDLFPLFIFKSVKFTVKYGNVPESSFIYAVYGLILTGVIGDIPLGYRFGKLALNLSGRSKTGALRTRTNQIVYSFVFHWKQHLGDSIQPLKKTYQIGLETGDFEYAGYSALFYSVYSFFAGYDLEVLHEELAIYQEAIRQLKHETSYYMHAIYQQSVSNIRGESKDPCQLVGKFYNESQMLSIHIEANDKTTTCNLYFNRLLLCYLFGEYSKAAMHAVDVKKTIEGVTGTYIVPLFYFYYSLTLLAIFNDQPDREKKRILTVVGANLKKLKKWAKSAPMNHLNKYNLVKAELSRVLDHNEDAMKYYDKAALLSQEHGYTNEEALSYELAASYYFMKKKDIIGKAYIQTAYDKYIKWGAIAKVKNLETKFDKLFISEISERKREKTLYKKPKKTTGKQLSENLDLSSVMKAALALSGEITMTGLLNRLMQLIIENAGAQIGFLILKSDGHYHIKASIDTDDKKINVLQSSPLDDSRALSKDIVRFVLRSGENVVIHDAMQENQFARDHYIIENSPRSVLCMPIRRKDHISGVLYVENNLTTYAFTEGRIKILNILLSQAAISLENAILYEDLKQENFERKHAEKELLQLATAIEQTEEGVVITSKDGVIRYINPAFEVITGYTREDIYGKKTLIFNSNKNEPNLFTEIWRTISSGDFWSGRIITKKKDDTFCELEVRISPIKDEKNNIISFVSLNRDVTHEIELEKERRQSQKMEAIGTLAGGIAHDFNNILTAIMGYTEITMSYVEKGSLAHSNLKGVIKAGSRARDLVQQILTFSRQGDDSIQSVDIKIIVKETLKLLRASLPATIEIRQNFQKNTGLVMAGPTQIHQVIMNLCANAAHAMMNGGGVLEVSLVNAKFDTEIAGFLEEENSESFVKLKVRDTGCGMSRETMDRIFDPYFTTKEKGEGTGLGLAVVHGIVKTLGGVLTVESDLGKGSLFSIYFPKVDLKSSVEQKQIEPISRGSETILFVDDEEAIVNMSQQMLHRMGYTVVTQTDSQQALKMFLNQPEKYDLIITDLTMPKMTGLELASKIKAARKDIPIILCTGFNERVTEIDVKETGINEFLLKPVSMNEMSMIIRKVINQTA